jgi:hypothetical protein
MFLLVQLLPSRMMRGTLRIGKVGSDQVLIDLA